MHSQLFLIRRAGFLHHDTNVHIRLEDVNHLETRREEIQSVKDKQTSLATKLSVLHNSTLDILTHMLCYQFPPFLGSPRET